jgi:histidyl-tRNA synthetase
MLKSFPWLRVEIEFAKTEEIFTEEEKAFKKQCEDMALSQKKMYQELESKQAELSHRLSLKEMEESERDALAAANLRELERLHALEEKELAIRITKETADAEVQKALDKIAAIDALYEKSVDELTAICPDSKGARELDELFRALRACGLDKYCTFDFGVIRGLDYYTGTVFEVFDLAPENNRAMFGGGRYDNLVGLFVKNTVSGVGFGFGDVTLANFLVTHKLVPDLNDGDCKVLIARFEDVPCEEYLKLAATLRDAGIVTSTYLGTKKFGKQIDYASRQQFTHLVILGGDELAQGVAKVKNLQTREESVHALTELPAVLGK